MKLNLLWMYHDMMDLYGDKGNIQVLKTRCAKRGIECNVDTVTLHETVDCENYDLIFIGGGADREQKLLYEDLLSRKESLDKALKSQTFILLICGGYQLFGQYYIDGDGNKIEGLKFFDYVTETADRSTRCIGNIAIEATLDEQVIQVVGFENHGGQTRGVKTPFGKVLSGHGNSFENGFEGFYNGQVLGTYMHGPLLPKNPEVADFIIKKALAKRYGEIVLAPLDDQLEMAAKRTILKRLEL